MADHVAVTDPALVVNCSIVKHWNYPAEYYWLPYRVKSHFETDRLTGQSLAVRFLIELCSF